MATNNKEANMEKIIEKIQNLLDLSNNNPNEHEALAAALKAQELMAKYNIEINEISHADEEIVEESYELGRSHNHKISGRFANIIARNFCCKTYTSVSRSWRGGSTTYIVFYGYKRDAKIATQVFKYLFETANRLANNYYQKAYKNGDYTKNLKSSYMYGFSEGMDSVLSKQCTALMLVVPQEVEEAYNEYTKDFRVKRSRVNLGDARAKECGYSDGVGVAQARELT